MEEEAGLCEQSHRKESILARKSIGEQVTGRATSFSVALTLSLVRLVGGRASVRRASGRARDHRDFASPAPVRSPLIARANCCMLLIGGRSSYERGTDGGEEEKSRARSKHRMRQQRASEQITSVEPATGDRASDARRGEGGGRERARSVGRSSFREEGDRLNSARAASAAASERVLYLLMMAAYASAAAAVAMPSPLARSLAHSLGRSTEMRATATKCEQAS